MRYVHSRSVRRQIAFVADAYNVTLISDDDEYVYGGPGWVHGPDCGVHFGRRAVFYSDCTSAEGVLHEIAHVIVGKESVLSQNDESYVLIQFEWSLALWICDRLSRSMAHRFMAAVREYQDATSILSDGAGAYLLQDVGGRQGRLWKTGVARAQKIGLIDECHRPTFQNPTWGRIPKMPSKAWYRRWSGFASERLSAEEG